MPAGPAGWAALPLLQASCGVMGRLGRPLRGFAREGVGLKVCRRRCGLWIPFPAWPARLARRAEQKAKAVIHRRDQPEQQRPGRLSVRLAMQGIRAMA